MTTALTTLTLRDIADVAKVQRAVVSMWRNRPHAEAAFPESVRVVGGVEHFDRDAVVSYLERTGRGNNPEARLDAPVFGVPDESGFEDLVTLFCLHVCTGAELAMTSVAERDELAADVDPDDEFLRREVTALRAEPDVLRYVDELVEASLGAPDAWERLERGRAGRATAGRDLTGEAFELVRAVAAACALQLGPDGVHLVPGGRSGVLALAVADHFAGLVTPTGTDSSRALRRRATILGVEVALEATGPAVHLLSAVGLGTGEALDAVDNVVLDLGPGDVAVVLGPAAALCDELRGEHERQRAETLRPGNLALAVRLPRGLWREAHRQALGLWICVGRGGVNDPRVGDLAAADGGTVDLADLGADVAGAMSGGGGRSFRYARAYELSAILSGHRVVPRGASPPRLATAPLASHLDRINTARLVTSEALLPCDIPVRPAPGTVVLHRRSLGEMVQLGQAVVRRGTRIDPAHADPMGSVAVLSAEADTALRLDPFDAVKHYPRGARTEPGDLVIAERPRPRARVDQHGGSLVAAPSKILRLGPGADIGPYALATLIDQLPGDAAEWPTWAFPALPGEEVDRLERTLRATARYEWDLRRRLTATEDLTRALIDGVAAGAVTLSMDEQEGH